MHIFNVVNNNNGTAYAVQLKHKSNLFTGTNYLPNKH